MVVLDRPKSRSIWTWTLWLLDHIWSFWALKATLTLTLVLHTCSFVSESPFAPSFGFLSKIGEWFQVSSCCLVDAFIGNLDHYLEMCYELSLYLMALKRSSWYCPQPLDWFSCDAWFYKLCLAVVCANLSRWTASACCWNLLLTILLHLCCYNSPLCSCLLFSVQLEMIHLPLQSPFSTLNSNIESHTVRPGFFFYFSTHSFYAEHWAPDLCVMETPRLNWQSQPLQVD